MSVRTLYTCDRCKYERPSEEREQPFVILDGRSEPSFSLSDLCAMCVREFLLWVDAGKSARREEKK